MKKLSEKQRLRHRSVLLKSRMPSARTSSSLSPRVHRSIVEAWFEDRVEDVICIGAPYLPPNRLCLKDNLENTLDFLYDWRNSFRSLDPNSSKRQSWVTPSRRKNGLNSISRYYDFSKIEYTSTAVALILTAEYDRIRTILESVPPAINLRDWNKDTLTKLYEIGFFENIGHLTDIESQMITHGDLKTMRILSGRNSNDLAEVSSCISELSKFLEAGGNIISTLEIVTNNALSEAMINVAKWAYPDDHEFKHRHVGKWWITASADRCNKELTIVIFDQGASIPVTFPKKTWSTTTNDLLKKIISNQPKFDFANDGSYILGALDPGNSSTNQRHRGLGLPEMKEVIDLLGDGSLVIHSRGGVCKYDPVNKFSRKSVDKSIGGTLIEWTLKF